VFFSQVAEALSLRATIHFSVACEIELILSIFVFRPGLLFDPPFHTFYNDHCHFWSPEVFPDPKAKVNLT